MSRGDLEDALVDVVIVAMAIDSVHMMLDSFEIIDSWIS